MAKVRIRVAVGGARLEFRGRRAFYERCIEPLLRAAGARERAVEGGRSAGPGGGPARPLPDAARAYQPASPFHFNQFVKQVGPRAADADQRVMAFAFYLWNFEKRDTFRAGEIAAFFRTVQDDPPADLEDRLGDLAGRRRFLEPGAGDGAWRLTQKGVNYVKNRLLGPA